MKKKILNVAGMSTPESITFFGDNGDCIVDTVDLKSPPRYDKGKPYILTKSVKNIPLLRGYAVIIDLIINLCGKSPKNDLLSYRSYAPSGWGME